MICIVTLSKAKHDQVFSAALQNGHKIQISLQLPDCDLTGHKYDPLDFIVTLANEVATSSNGHVCDI